MFINVLCALADKNYNGDFEVTALRFSRSLTHALNGDIAFPSNKEWQLQVGIEMDHMTVASQRIWPTRQRNDLVNISSICGQILGHKSLISLFLISFVCYFHVIDCKNFLYAYY